MKKFSKYYSLSTALSFPLQVLTTREPWQYGMSKKTQGIYYKELKDFISIYKKNLTEEVLSDMQFSFRVYLIPKIGNNRSSSDTAIEFIKFDPSQPEQFENIQKDIALIKEKYVQVANQGKFKPALVSKLVEEKIGKKFSVTYHTRAWKYYKIRGRGKDANGCNVKYCQYDEPHKDYIYTQEWVDFLVNKLSNSTEYETVIHFK